MDEGKIWKINEAKTDILVPPNSVRSDAINDFWLVLGYACNNRCQHCYAEPSGFSGKWMSLSFAKEIMELLRKEAKTCLLLGGEPTLYPELVDVVSFGSTIGLKMVVVTNGRRFKDKDFAKTIFSAGLERAVVSLEGASPKTHNGITRCQSFHETTQGIRVCAELGKVNSLTTICRNNRQEILETVKLAYSLGVGKAVLNCAIPILNKDKPSADYCLNPSELAETINKLFQQALEENIDIQLNATLPLCLLDDKLLDKALERGWISAGCHMYRGKGVVFDPKGNILPCTHFSENSILKGKINRNGCFSLKDKFYEIWNDSGSAAGKFRSSLWRYPARKCSKCKFWGWCIGGCPLLWSYFDPLVYIDRQKGGDKA